MVEINVQKNQGLTHAIKAKLTEQGYDASKLQGSIWSQVMQEVTAQNAQNIKDGKSAIYKGGSDLSGSGAKNFVVQAGIIELAQGLWDKIVSLVTGKLVETKTENVSSTANVDKIKAVPETRTETPANVDVPADLKQNVEKAQKYLLEQLPNLSDEDLQKMGISAKKRDRITEYLKNITYDTDHDSAQAIGSGIVFSTNCKDSGNLANMITLLMHEANHCDENYLTKYPEDSETTDLRHRDSKGNVIKYEGNRINTKEEERACETLGLLTTAILIKNGKISGQDDWGRYGEPKNPVINYLDNKELLQKDIENWVSNYTNYPEGINNAGLTVEHLHNNDKVQLSDDVRAKKLQLQAGDIIKIGDKEYTLGGNDGIVLTPRDSVPVFEMIPHGDTGKPSIGTLTFDAVPITQQEKDFFIEQHNNDIHCFDFLNDTTEEITVIRDGKKVAKGKYYRP